MNLSIIILTYKSKNLVRFALKDLLASNLPEQTEVIVVDNDSGDGIEDMIEEEYPQVRFIQTGKNSGFAAGNNAGIKAAFGKYIIIMNPDIFVEDNSIEKLYNYIKEKEGEGVGLVAPKLCNPNGSLQHTCYKFHKWSTPLFRRTFLSKLPFGKKHLKKFLMDDWDHNSIREVDWVQGSCFIMRKDLLEQIGCFDEKYFMYVEDMDLCRKINLAGKKVIYYPESKVIHLHRRESNDGKWHQVFTNKLTREHIKSWLKYMWKFRKGNLNELKKDIKM
ncbi:MAG TPA: glycosyltransferase family 2 protein [Candidatus Bipolaricaulota bacterium]|nr:glycosyltransferase family 2 protein [Candidatus Bipolaricaulota bacterium]